MPKISRMVSMAPRTSQPANLCVNTRKQAGLHALLPATLACLLALCLTQCFHENDVDPYPDLTVEELAGCWTEIDPQPNDCLEMCFTLGGGGYLIILFDSLSNGISEDSGSYVIDENEIHMNSIARNTTRPEEERNAIYTRVIIDDTLYAIGRTRLIFPHVRSDSTHNCRPYWRLFERPEDWEL